MKAGERVEKGQRMVIVESMKMEIAVATPCDAIVVEVLCGPGAAGGSRSLYFCARKTAELEIRLFTDLN